MKLDFGASDSNGEHKIDHSVESAWRAMRDNLQESSNEAGCQNLIFRLLNASTIPASTLDTSNATARLTLGHFGLTESEVNGSLGRLGPYTILRVIGHGGMSTVFEAFDERLGRAVAIKVQAGTTLNPQNQARFAREARSQAAVTHPSLLPIYDVSQTSTGIPFLVTELAKFGTWREHLNHKPRDDDNHQQDTSKAVLATTNFRLVAEVIATVADGLSVAHAAGVVHRDIKPSNILLCSLAAGSNFHHGPSDYAEECHKLGWQPKLSDFGLARPISHAEQVTSSAVLSGTPAYMSPEQIIAPERVTTSTDVYSLGVTLYESLSGEVPFRGNTHAVLQQIVLEEPPRPSRFQARIPQDLEWICMKAMNHDPGSRYRNATEFGDDLRNWLAGRPVIAKPPTWTGKIAKWCRRNPRVAILSGTIVGLMVVLTVGSLSASWWILDSQQELQKRTMEAMEASKRAVASADLANQQRMITLDTINELVVRVQDQLEKRPDTLEIRESLLKKAFEGLEKVTSSLDLDASIDRTFIDAHIRMSSIKLDQGDRDAAIHHTRSAVNLAERALTQKPNDIECWRDLANALSREMELHTNAFAYEESNKVAERLINARSKVCELTPFDGKALRALIAAKQRLADQSSMQGKLENSLQTFRELISDLSAVSALPDPIDTRRDQLILNSRVGTLNTQLRRYSEANEAFDRALALNDALMGEDRSNVLFRNDKAFLLAKLASLKSAMNQHEEAVRLAESVLNMYMQLAKEDSERIQSHTLVGTAYHLLYQVYFAKRDFESAIDYESESYENAMRVSKLDMNSSRHPQLASEAASCISDLNFRIGHLSEAALWAERSHQALRNAAHKVDFDPKSTSLEIRMREANAKAFQLAIQGESVCQEAIKIDQSAGSMALAILAYEHARSGSSSIGYRMLKELMKLPTMEKMDQAFVNIFLIRALSKCTESAENEEREDMSRYAMELARDCVATIPRLKNSFLTDPEFEYLRQYDQFMSLLQ